MRRTTGDVARSLFLQAVALPESERAAFVDRISSDDPSTGDLVRELLRADAEAGSFLEKCSLDEVAGDAEELSPGDWIGAYRLERLLGEGGIGRVWSAEQHEPVRRTVALKVLRAGMDSQAVIQRFEAERQALALMAHPYIARVFDAGTTPAGRPYFVMELVSGTPITAWCDRRGLSLAGRLQLLVRVCQAVEHAHCKGIIHRDLKPANVLVEEVDGEPIPKVIDFGIAKATRARLTEHTLATESGQLLGTPRYMSPEQADLRDVDIDTRSDVYALGSLAYELLTGRPVLDVDPARDGYLAVLQAVRDLPPVRPSLVDARLRGDLDTILLKALEKDRERRYASAGDLGRDVQRHLDDEPIEARPPTILYQLGKLARRHRLAVGAGVGVLVVLTAATAVASILAVRAAEARDDASAKANALEEEQERTRRARDDAQARAVELEEQQKRLETVVDFQRQALQGLSAADMGRQIEEEFVRSARTAGLDDRAIAALDRGVNGTDLAKAVVDRQILQRAARAIDTDFAEDPVSAAELQASLASMYRDMGWFTQAMEHMRKAHALNEAELGPHHEETLKAVLNIGNLMGALGQLVEADEYYEDMYAQCLDALGPDHELTVLALNGRAWLAYELGRATEAYELNTEALERFRQVMGEDDPRTLAAITNMGVVERQMGNHERAHELLSEAWSGLARTHGPADIRTLTCQATLVMTLEDLGRVEEATAQLRDMLPRLEEAYGRHHPDTLEALASLGELEVDMGRVEEGLVHLRKAVDGLEAAQGKDARRVLEVRARLVEALRQTGNLDESLALADETLALCDETLARDDDARVRVALELACTLAEVGEHQAASELYEEAVELRRRAFGERHPRVAVLLSRLGAEYQALGRWDEGDACFEEALSIQEERFAPGSSAAAASLLRLALAGIERGDRERVVELLDRAGKALDRALVDPTRDVADEHFQSSWRAVRDRLPAEDAARVQFERSLAGTYERLLATDPDDSARSRLEGARQRALPDEESAR